MDQETIALLGAGLMGIIALGRLISKFTKTDADDKFFARAGSAIGGFFKRG